ncbi:MAG: polysaccharide pyruvyl transferase family protein [Candidatus Limnocylindria bacterium]
MIRDADGRSPLRIATVGFQGFENIGDEAILTGIEAALGSTDARVTTVFSGPRPEGIAAFPAARRVVAWRHLPALSAVRILRRTDLLILAGGGIFNDHWTAVIPRYLAWVLAARLAGARVALVGVGVGPIRRRWLRWLARLAARASTLVLVRDPVSAGLLGSLDGVRVIPDPSLFNPPPASVAARTELGLIVRAPTRADAARRNELLDALATAAATAHGRGVQPLIFTMAGEADRAFADAVAHAMEREGLGDVRREGLGPTPAAALQRLASLSGLITVRLHGLLLGVLAGVPTIPIAYDDKVRVAADRLGLRDLVVPLAGVSAADLLDRLDSVAADERQAAVRACLQALRSERDDLAAAVMAIGRRP